MKLPRMIALYTAQVICRLSLKWAGAFLTVKHKYTPYSRNTISTVERKADRKVFFEHYNNVIDQQILAKYKSFKLNAFISLHMKKTIQRFWALDKNETINDELPVVL